MTYHLSRAAYWLQERSILDHAGGSIRQLDSPPNAEVLMAWSLAMARGDGWVALVQWTALGGTAVAIAVTARTLGAARAPALFAAAVFVILPGPVLESVTTQNDLVACFTATSAVALGVTGLARGHRGLLVLAGVALGIGIGVKGTVLFGLPAVGLILLAAAVKARAWRGLGGLIAAAVVATAALGAFGYIEAFVREGDPFGGVREQTERITPVPATRCAWPRRCSTRRASRCRGRTAPSRRSPGRSARGWRTTGTTSSRWTRRSTRTSSPPA